MFGIVLSALNVALGFVFKSVLIKFVLFFGLFFVVTEFVQVLADSSLLPKASDLNGVLVGIPSGVWFFLDLFNFSLGLPMVISAMVTKFIIRRIPVIG